MKLDTWKIIWGILLIVLSTIAYVMHYLIFRDPHHLFIFLVGDFAFVFIEVLLVTMIIHELLNYREKKAMMGKLNMLIGAFFSEVGSNLLRIFAKFDHSSGEIKQRLIECGQWPDDKFEEVGRECAFYVHNIDCDRGNLRTLRDFLVENRPFMLNLLQNPKLIAHETFTNLLWSIFHLTEELGFRVNVSELCESDYRHIAGDIERAYGLLITEWLQYMRYLKEDYPYLFSLAIRMNPFDPEASPEVKEA
ncbi:MAG: hypothetical protein PHU03_07545 [Syntrophales bacterium]|nr:hypothetical protein [Syntrophales bacterium]